MKKLIRTSTIAMSLDLLLKGQLSFLSRHYEVVAVSGDDEHLERVKERERVRTHGLSMARQISPIQDLISLVKLYLFFRKEKPHIVHSITPKAGLLSMIAARLAGVPIRMHTFTGLIFPTSTGLKRKILIWMDRLLCRMATHIYPEGNGVRNDLIQFGITNKPLKILGNGNVNGIDLAFFDPDLYTADDRLATRGKIGIGERDFVFVFVGRLVTDKGISELVGAFDRLAAEIGNVSLLLVGPRESDLTPLPDATEAIINRHSRIFTTGFQNDIRSYLYAADVFVFPSYREGFPNVVLQAGAMGLPSIVTDINGSNEIVEDGRNGVIVPPRNADALRKAMSDLAGDADAVGRMRMHAREMIASRFSQEHVWEALLTEYSRLDALKD